MGVDADADGILTGCRNRTCVLENPASLAEPCNTSTHVLERSRTALAFSLAVAFVVTVPVNRAMIARGKGHAVVHEYHH